MKAGRSLRIRTSTCALSCALVFLWVDVQAQQAPAPSSSDVLEEVFVTAKRRSEDIQKASISAVVLSSELLTDKGVTDLFQLQYAAPSIQVVQYGSANVFNIRGIGRSQVDIDVPSGVVIYRDGAPTLAGYFQNEPYYDMKSVEVFRGPQGTFVGKSAAGGAVFINTADPQLHDFTGSVELGMGNYSSAEGTAIFNIPVGDTAAIRASYRHYERDDFYDSITGNYTGHPGQVNNQSYRLYFLWQPGDAFTGTLKLDYHDLDFGGNVTTVYGEAPLGDVQQNANFAYTDTSFRGVLNLQFKFGGGATLTSLTGYQKVDSTNNLDANATVPLYFEFDSQIDAKIYSQELDLVSSNEGKLRWVVGAFWEKQDNKLPPWQEKGFNFVGNGFPPDYPWATSPWDNTEEDWAVFAHGGFKFTDALELEAGVRYSDYKRDQFTHWLLGFGSSPPFLEWTTEAGGLPPNGGDSKSISEDSVDWQVALNWNASADQFLYGLISRGHVTGGINIFPNFDAGFPAQFLTYKEMEVINYETGWKANWASNRLDTQFAIYYQTFDNYQANFAEITLNGLNSPTNRNAETQSTLYGFEFSGQARFDALSIDFGAAYLHTKLGTFSNVVDPFRPAGDANGDGVADNIVNLSGARSPFSPEWTGSLGVSYGIHMGSATLTPRVDVSYQAESQGALWDTPMETLPERTLINAQLTLEGESGKWMAQVWGTNITDKEYIAGIQNNATLYYAAPPGQFGARVRFSF